MKRELVIMIILLSFLQFNCRLGKKVQSNSPIFKYDKAFLQYASTPGRNLFLNFGEFAYEAFYRKNYCVGNDIQNRINFIAYDQDYQLLGINQKNSPLIFTDLNGDTLPATQPLNVLEGKMVSLLVKRNENLPLSQVKYIEEDSLIGTIDRVELKINPNHKWKKIPILLYQIKPNHVSPVYSDNSKIQIKRNPCGDESPMSLIFDEKFVGYRVLILNENGPLFDTLFSEYGSLFRRISVDDFENGEYQLHIICKREFLDSLNREFIHIDTLKKELYINKM